MDDFEIELKQGFLEESMQALDDAEQAFLALENISDDPSILDQIFRLAHNLKGTSRAVGFGEVAEFTHVMENLILKLKEGELSVSEIIVNTLLECNDHLRMMTEGLKDNLEATFDSNDLIQKLDGLVSGEIPTDVEEAEDVAAAEQNEDVDDFVSDEADSGFDEESMEPVSDLVEETLNMSDEQQLEEIAELETVAEQTESLPAELSAEDEEDLDIPTVPAMSEGSDTQEVVSLEAVEDNGGEQESENQSSSPPATPPSPPSAGSGDNKTKKVAAKVDESIRVSLGRLEKLNNFVGELVIIQSVLNQHRTEVKSTLVLKSLSQLNKLSKEIHHMSMSLRMIPIKSTLQKMQRIVRDTSKTLGKKVNLVLIGEDTEVDKTVLEHLNDPLVHIVRNAVDHGLEDGVDRIRAGKNEEGTVKISCFHEGNNLVIEVSDNGGGIPPEIIRKKAEEKGLLKKGATVSDQEVINYIFHPGFSTKEKVTEVSGRGVGMDVVKTNIEGLNGNISVKSVVGKGSVFRVELPLTMAVIEGMIVQIGGEKYVFPLSQISETLRPEREKISFVTGIGEVYNLRGDTLPIFRMSNVLKQKVEEKDTTDLIAVIVRNKGMVYAILVDDIYHQQQIVIKKLGQEISNKKGFMGSSILGDGMPALIVDLHEIIDSKQIKSVNSRSNRQKGAA